MKEYSIFIKQGSGTPYFLNSYSNIHLAKRAIYNLVNAEEKRNRMYYVDNDFFNNKYTFCSNLKYMCIKEREVSNWQKYSEEMCNVPNDKIIYINFKK